MQVDVDAEKDDGFRVDELADHQEVGTGRLASRPSALAELRIKVSKER